jgi:hypothetical protein
MRPVDANPVANFAAQQFVAGHAEQFCFGVEQGVFDRTERLRHHATGAGTGRCEKLGIDTFVLEGILSHHPRRETLDHRADAGRTKTFVEFTPADDAVFGGDLEEMVVSPAGIAGEDFHTSYLGGLCHFIPLFFVLGRCRSCAANCP